MAQKAQQMRMPSERRSARSVAGGTDLASPKAGEDLAKVKKEWLFHHITVAKCGQIGCNILRGVIVKRLRAFIRGDFE